MNPKSQDKQKTFDLGEVEVEVKHIPEIFSKTVFARNVAMKLINYLGANKDDVIEALEISRNEFTLAMNKLTVLVVNEALTENTKEK